MKIEVHLASNPMKIPQQQLVRTFQVARDSIPRLRITKIVNGSLAECLKLRAGDMIVKANGKPVSSLIELSISRFRAGAEGVELLLRRDGKEISVRLHQGQLGIRAQTEYL